MVPGERIDENGNRYIVLEVNCFSCHESITPQQTEMELFRLGFPVHRVELKPECLSKLGEKLVKMGWIDQLE